MHICIDKYSIFLIFRIYAYYVVKLIANKLFAKEAFCAIFAQLNLVNKLRLKQVLWQLITDLRFKLRHQ